MHYNSRSCVARVVWQCLEIPTHNWDARSPDLSLIEHVWDHLVWQFQQQQTPIRTLHDICEHYMITFLWHMEKHIIQLQQYTQNLFRSLPRRIEAVIRAGGINTCFYNFISRFSSNKLNFFVYIYFNIFLCFCILIWLTGNIAKVCFIKSFTILWIFITNIYDNKII